MLSCGQLCGGLIVLLIGFVINALYQVGEFSILFPYNVRHCRRIEGYHGCEDFAYFGNSDVSCDDRSWLRYHAMNQEYNLTERIARQKEQGILYLLPHGKYDKAEKVKLRGYTRPDFHPLGIASMEDDTGKWVYVTDNRRDGEVVELFRVISRNELEFYAEFRFDPPTFEPSQMLNDIIAIPNSGGSFYVTIWLVQEPGTFGNFIDVYLKRPVSYILFCEAAKDFLKSKGGQKSKGGFQCRKVVEGLKMVNGITRSPDGKRIYVSETTGKLMRIYDRNPKTNDLTLVKKISTHSGCDNLEIAEDGKTVYLGCHPKGLSFQFHAAYPDKLVAPSRILKFTDNNSDNDDMEVEMVSTGEILSGSSLGMKMGSTLIVGSVHDDCYLLCEDQ